jgi:hypothetical protein
MSFNPAILQTKVTWVMDIDTVTVTRSTIAIVAGAPVTSTSTIFSGTADFQEGGGRTYYNADGAIEQADATLIIDASPLPSVNVGDTVTSPEGKTYTVVNISSQPFIFPHLVLMLKRGGVDNIQG